MHLSSSCWSFLLVLSCSRWRNGLAFVLPTSPAQTSFVTPRASTENFHGFDPFGVSDSHELAGHHVPEATFIDDGTLTIWNQWLPSSLLADASKSAATASDTTEDGRLSSAAIVAIFIVGVIPFAVATVEFWRRIAVGESFGTGQDSVVIIGEDDAPLSSRGRRVLGKGALALAYVLFAIAAAVLTLVVVSMITSPPLPSEL